MESIELSNLLSGDFDSLPLRSTRGSLSLRFNLANRPLVTKLKIFISGSDSSLAEQNLLHEHILPRLRERGRQRGIDVSFVDLRSGLRKEEDLHFNYADTANYAISECFNESSGLSFISLQNDKLGVIYLPKKISEDKFNEKIGQFQIQNKHLPEKIEKYSKLFSEWYELDENSIPSSYILKRASSMSLKDEQEYHNHILPSLLEYLHHIELSEDLEERIFIGQCRTEQEIRYAFHLKNKLQESRVNRNYNNSIYWLQRCIDIDHHDRDRDHTTPSLLSSSIIHHNEEKYQWIEPAPPTTPVSSGTASLPSSATSMIDASTSKHLAELKSFMHSHMSGIQKFHISLTSCMNQDHDWKEYLEKFENSASYILFSELDNIIDEQLNRKALCQEMNVPPSYLDDILFHIQFMKQTNKTFYGRDELLGQALKIISASDKKSTETTTDTNTTDHPNNAANGGPGGDMGDMGLFDLFGGGFPGLFPGLGLPPGFPPGLPPGFPPGLPPGFPPGFPMNMGAGPGFSLLSAPPEVSERALAGICLVVTGVAGLGKTSLMAKLAVKLREVERMREDWSTIGIKALPARPVLFRACGLTRNSRNGLFLVQSLIAQIQFIITQKIRQEEMAIAKKPGTISDSHTIEGKEEEKEEQKTEKMNGKITNSQKQKAKLASSKKETAPKLHLKPIPTTYSKAVELFQALINEVPVILILAGLDKLDDLYQERSRLSFLRGIKPHKHTRIIVSCIKDDVSVTTKTRGTLTEEENSILAAVSNFASQHNHPIATPSNPDNNDSVNNNTNTIINNNNNVIQGQGTTNGDISVGQVGTQQGGAGDDLAVSDGVDPEGQELDFEFAFEIPGSLLGNDHNSDGQAEAEVDVENGLEEQLLMNLQLFLEEQGLEFTQAPAPAAAGLETDQAAAEPTAPATAGPPGGTQTGQPPESLAQTLSQIASAIQSGTNSNSPARTSLMKSQGESDTAATTTATNNNDNNSITKKNPSPAESNDPMLRKKRFYGCETLLLNDDIPRILITYQPRKQSKMCKAGHDMVISSHCGGEYAGGFVCDKCRKHYSAGVERWLCRFCTSDFCHECDPKPSAIEECKVEHFLVETKEEGLLNREPENLDIFDEADKQDHHNKIIHNYKHCKVCTQVLEENKQIVKLLLQNKNRVLTSSQLEIIYDKIIQFSSILYIKLIVFEASSWKSTDDPSKLKLADSIDGIVNQIFSRLELDYGIMLVRAVFSYLAFAKEGLTDNEMEDLLSLNDIAIISSFPILQPNYKRIPTVSWYIIKSQIRDLLHENEVGCLQFCHALIHEAAMKRYSMNNDYKQRILSILGLYFSDRVDPLIRSTRRIIHQKILLTDISEDATVGSDMIVKRPSRDTGKSASSEGIGGDKENLPVWISKPHQINIRRLAEATDHLIKSGLVLEAIEELCNLEIITCRFKVDRGRDQLRYLALLKDQFDIPTTKKIDHYLRWLILDYDSIVKNPNLIMTYALTQPLISKVRYDAERVLTQTTELHHGSENPRISRSFLQLDAQNTWVRCKQLGGKSTYSKVIALLTGHSTTITCVKLSCSGRLLASTSDEDNAIYLWDTSSSINYAKLTGHTAPVLAVDWNEYRPDNPRLVSGSVDRSIVIWDASSGEILHKITGGHGGPVTSVCFSPDGKKLVSGAADFSIGIFDAEGGSLGIVLVCHMLPVTCVSWSPDGKSIASSSADRTIRIWDNEKNNFTKILGGHPDAVTTVSWSSDSKKLSSACADGTLRVWDMEKVKVLAIFRNSKLLTYNYSLCFDWSQDCSAIITSTSDKRLLIWDINLNRITAHLYGTSNTKAISWSRNGKRIAQGCVDKKIRIWDAEDLIGCLDDSQGHSDIVMNAMWSPDNQTILSCSLDGSILLSDVDSGRVLMKFDGHPVGLVSMDWRFYSQRIISCGANDSTIKVWDTSNGRLLATLQGHAGYQSFVSFSPNGHYFASSGAYDTKINIWSGKTLELITTLTGNHNITCIQWSTDLKGKWLASSNIHKELVIWDTRNWMQVTTYKNELKDIITSLAWNHDSTKIALGYRNKRIEVLDVSLTEGFRLESSRYFLGHVSIVSYISWSYDDQLLVSCGLKDNCIRVWNVSSCTLLGVLEGHTDVVNSARWSYDNKKIVSTSSDKTTRIWDIITYLKSDEIDFKEGSGHHNGHHNHSLQQGVLQQQLDTPKSPEQKALLIRMESDLSLSTELNNMKEENDKLKRKLYEYERRIHEQNSRMIRLLDVLKSEK